MLDHLIARIYDYSYLEDFVFPIFVFDFVITLLLCKIRCNGWRPRLGVMSNTKIRGNGKIWKQRITLYRYLYIFYKNNL